MEDIDRNTIHGTAELSSGNREDLFSPTVTDTLINIVCSGCGCVLPDHYSWEEHIRDMVELEDTDHAFFTQVVDSDCGNVVLDGEHQCPDCGNGYKTEEERDNHRMTIGTSVRLVCSQCASLVPDMELHIPIHKSESKCGECGGKMADLKSHMVDKHSGFMSVLILQTIRCAGDGSTLVSLEIVLATNARFLASEVKPFVPEAPTVKKKGQKRKPEVVEKTPEVPAKKPVIGIKVKDEFLLKEEPGDMEDEFFNGFNLMDEFSMGDGSDVVVSPKKKKPKKNGIKQDKGDSHLEFEMSERDRALCPPATIPEEFFDSTGARVWNKLPARKGLHQCELCGFNAKTKNKYREKQDHLMKWHFSKRIEKILPVIGKKPFYCPLCPFMGKDRQCVVRHYTGKHQALDVWMAEFLDAVSFKTLTEDTLQTVENVDILGKLGEPQKPFRGKIVNTIEDLKDFLDVSYESPTKDQHKCDQCSQTFPSNSALKSHTLIDHNTKSRYERDLSARSEVIKSTSVQLSSSPQSAEVQSISITPISITPTTTTTPVQPDLYKSKRLRNRLEKEQEESKKEAEEEKEKVLILEDVVGGGLRCLTCSGSKDEALLKSIGELKDHVQNNHMDLCLHEFFVLCQTNTASSPQPTKKFYYTLCCLCGKCFSQNSTDIVLENHRAEHHALSEQDC